MAENPEIGERHLEYTTGIMVKVPISHMVIYSVRVIEEYLFDGIIMGQLLRYGRILN